MNISSSIFNGSRIFVRTLLWFDAIFLEIFDNFIELNLLIKTYIVEIIIITKSEFR